MTTINKKNFVTDKSRILCDVVDSQNLPTEDILYLFSLLEMYSLSLNYLYAVIFLRDAN